MPASSRPRRLHLLGSNARIYIAQECTTMGSRRLHLPCARAQPIQACTKRIHAPLHACAKRRVHLPCTRPRDACTVPLQALDDVCACRPSLFTASEAYEGIRISKETTKE